MMMMMMMMMVGNVDRKQQSLYDCLRFLRINVRKIQARMLQSINQSIKEICIAPPTN